VYKKISLIVICLLLVLVPLTACAPHEEAPTQPTPAEPAPTEPAPAEPTPTEPAPAEPPESVKIGVLVSQSGAYAGYGKPSAEGIELAVNDINSSGGIKSLGGAKLELIIADAQTDPTIGKEEAERLLDVEKVSIILGPWSTTIQESIAPMCEQREVPMIGIAGGAGVLSALNLRYWRTIYVPIPVIGSEMARMTKLLKDEYGVNCERIALSTYESTGSQVIMDAAVDAFEEYGMKDNVVLYELFPLSSTSLESHVLKLQEANPDVVLAVHPLGHSTMFMKAVYSLDFHPPVLIHSESKTNALREALGQDLWEATVNQPGVFSFESAPVDADYKPLQDFLVKCETAGVEEPSSYFFAGAQAAYLVRHALEQCGSSDPVAINDALREISIPEGDSDLVMPCFAPDLSYQPNGDLVNAIEFLVQWQENEVKIIKPEPYGTVTPRLVEQLLPD
jgi:branched-chain amino acid transport system substrate-binding protein